MHNNPNVLILYYHYSIEGVFSSLSFLLCKQLLMKYSILILALIFLWLTWCSQQEKPIINLSTVSINNNTNSILSWWKLPWLWSIIWIKNTIIISWYQVTYKDLFYINIPQYLTQRSYDNQTPHMPKYENLVFAEKTYTQYFYISLAYISWENIYLSHKEVCLLRTDYNWSQTSSKQTITKNIHNKDVFITRLSFFTEWNLNPYTYITHFCFIDDAIIYDLVLDNYNFPEANHMLDSFTFLD